MRTIFLIMFSYCFVYITAIQLACNLIYLFSESFYNEYSFYFTYLTGTSFSYILPLLAATFLFKFCEVSRICAVTQLVLSILWLVIQEDNVYNIAAQNTFGILSLLFTYIRYKQLKEIEKLKASERK
jgi:hypothetical protein